MIAHLNLPEQNLLAPAANHIFKIPSYVITTSSSANAAGPLTTAQIFPADRCAILSALQIRANAVGSGNNRAALYSCTATPKPPRSAPRRPPRTRKQFQNMTKSAGRQNASGSRTRRRLLTRYHYERPAHQLDSTKVK